MHVHKVKNSDLASLTLYIRADANCCVCTCSGTHTTAQGKLTMKTTKVEIDYAKPGHISTHTYNVIPDPVRAGQADDESDKDGNHLRPGRQDGANLRSKP